MQVRASVVVANSCSTNSQQSPQQHSSSQQPPPARMVRRSPALLVLLALLSVLVATAQHQAAAFGRNTINTLSEDDIIAKEVQWAKNRARLHQQGFQLNPTFHLDVDNEAVFTMPTHEPYEPTVRSTGSHFVTNLRGSRAFP